MIHTNWDDLFITRCQVLKYFDHVLEKMYTMYARVTYDQAVQGKCPICGEHGGNTVGGYVRICNRHRYQDHYKNKPCSAVWVTIPVFVPEREQYTYYYKIFQKPESYKRFLINTLKISDIERPNDISMPLPDDVMEQIYAMNAPSSA